MAITIAQANAVSGYGYDKTLTSIVYEDSPLFVRLKQKNRVKQDGGTNIRWTVRYQELGNAEAVAPRAQVSYEGKDTRTAASLGWAYYVDHTIMSWDERLENSGKERIINLIEDKTKELKEDMYEKFADDLYATSAGTYNFQPLAVCVDSSTTYAGIATTDVSAWASTESASVTLTLFSGTNSLAFMVAAATFGSKKPDLHITHPNIQNKFESLMIDQVRYEDVEMANAGFQNITFKGAPVIGDPHCNSTYWYGLNTDDIEFVVHPDYAFNVSEWIDGKPMGFPEALVKVMTVACNLKFKRRDTHFKYTGLVYTN